MNAQPADGLISVVVPAFNAAKYISRTLASVSRQTHRALEIIVVDDGSTDNTATLVEVAKAADPRISLVRSEHRGVSHARNLGIAKAHGRYIAPLDADDLWTRDKLARQFEILHKAPGEVGVVYCWAAGIDDSDDIILPVWNASHATGDVLHEIVQTGILSCGSTPLIRSEFVPLAGGYDESLHLAEDWKFYTALAGVCRFEVIPECLTGYRIRHDSSSVNLDPMQLALRDFTQWVVARWPDLPKDILAKREFSLNTYLAFMATRARQYRRVPGYLARALHARPVELFGLTFWEFAVFPFAYAIGVRNFKWKFWERPRRFGD